MRGRHRVLWTGEGVGASYLLCPRGFLELAHEKDVLIAAPAEDGATRGHVLGPRSLLEKRSRTTGTARHGLSRSALCWILIHQVSQRIGPCWF